MAVDTTWTDPSTAGAIDLNAGGFLTEVIYDKILSNLKRLGGTDGNTKTGGYTSLALTTPTLTDPIYSSIVSVTAQFTKTDTTLENVTGLTINMTASGVYSFRAVLFISNSGGGADKVAIGGTCTATTIRYYADVVGNTNAIGQGASAHATALGGAQAFTDANNDIRLIRIEGLITVNAAGTLTVQFSQNSASGQSSVMVGSNFEGKRLS